MDEESLVERGFSEPELTDLSYLSVVEDDCCEVCYALLTQGVCRACGGA